MADDLEFKGFKPETLTKLYDQAVEKDKSLFAEQRTNILLRNGEHYTKRGDSFYEGLRARGVIKSDEDNKIRLTKNKIPKIVDIYFNQIIDTNPSATAAAFNQNELADIKAAELNNGVLSWIKEENDWKTQQPDHIDDFVVVGEVFGRVRWDYDRGPMAIDAETGEPTKAGGPVIEKFFGWDAKIDPSARSFNEAKWVCFDTVMDKADVIAMLVDQGKQEEASKLNLDGKEMYKIYDQNTGTYIKKADKMIVREWYWRPDRRRPKGWYVLVAGDNIEIVQQELPMGIWPVAHGRFERITASPRGASKIRVARPYQLEVNRSSSKMAEHQITLGDDKVYINQGTKLSNGGKFNGVQAIRVNGAMPVITAGRTGEQYLGYVQNEIQEMYDSTDVASAMQDNAKTNDPWMALLTAAKDKKKFGKYVQSYQNYEVQLFKIALAISKEYLEDAHTIQIIGKKDIVNIEEFKKSNTGFEIKVVESDSTLEDKFGKVLTLTQVLQYVGSNMTPEQVAAIIKQLPYGNKDAVFDPITSDLDNATNDILALDRGEYRPANAWDNHDFMVKALTNRQKQSDFIYINPQVQQMYAQKIQEHNQHIVQQQQAIAQGKMGQIPVGGMLISVIASFTNPSTGKPERLKLPSEALQWLTEMLAQQGYYNQMAMTQDPYNQAMQSEMSQMAPQEPMQILNGSQAQ